MFAKKMDARFSKKADFKAEVAEVRIADEKILLVHPLTYMNLSGEAVAAIQQYYKVSLKDILLVHDEMDFAAGTMAFAAKGRDAGHNGVASIHEMLKTTAINRLRLGIGRPRPPIEKEVYVLEKFSTDEITSIKKMSTRATEAMEDWVKSGIDKSMNTWNGV